MRELGFSTPLRHDWPNETSLDDFPPDTEIEVRFDLLVDREERVAAPVALTAQLSAAIPGIPGSEVTCTAPADSPELPRRLACLVPGRSDAAGRLRVVWRLSVLTEDFDLRRRALVLDDSWIVASIRSPNLWSRACDREDHPPDPGDAPCITRPEGAACLDAPDCNIHSLYDGCGGTSPYDCRHRCPERCVAFADFDDGVVPGAFEELAGTGVVEEGAWFARDRSILRTRATDLQPTPDRPLRVRVRLRPLRIDVHELVVLSVRNASVPSPRPELQGEPEGTYQLRLLAGPPPSTLDFDEDADTNTGIPPQGALGPLARLATQATFDLTVVDDGTTAEACLHSSSIDPVSYCFSRTIAGGGPEWRVGFTTNDGDARVFGLDELCVGWIED